MDATGLGPPTPTALQQQNWHTAHDAASQLISRISYDGSGNPEYVGLAAPDTAEETAGWQIRKLSYDGGGNVIAVNFADGDARFDNVWTGRAGLSYA